MKIGFVYILTNEAMPDLVKIGRTSRDVELRASELWQTGVPAPFEIFTKVNAPDCVSLEAKMHGVLRRFRVSKSREFFRIEPNKAARLLIDLHRREVEDWLFEFGGDLVGTPIHTAVEPSAIERIARESDTPAWLVSKAIAHISLEEIKPALERAKTHEEQIDAGGLSAFWDWRPENNSEDDQ